MLGNLPACMYWGNGHPSNIGVVEAVAFQARPLFSRCRTSFFSCKERRRDYQYLQSKGAMLYSAMPSIAGTNLSKRKVIMMLLRSFDGSRFPHEIKPPAAWNVTGLLSP